MRYYVKAFKMKMTDEPTTKLENTFNLRIMPNLLLITWTITENYRIFDYFGLSMILLGFPAGRQFKIWEVAYLFTGSPFYVGLSENVEKCKSVSYQLS